MLLICMSQHCIEICNIVHDISCISFDIGVSVFQIVAKYVASLCMYLFKALLYTAIT